MTKRSLFAKSLFLAIFFVNIHEYRAVYNDVEVTVEPLHPVGLRMSIPDEEGITLVAFHVKINEDFYGLEAGQIARDIVKVRNGRWTYQDRQTQLNRGDIIYYWVHVVYRGLGYNTVDKSYPVTDFYNSDGTIYIGNKAQDQDQTSCTRPSVTWVFKNGGRRQACSQELLFEDHFDTINATTWNSIQRFANHFAPDYEFVVYMTNDVTDVSNGWLRIKPIPLDTKFSNREFTSNGELELEGCTGKVGTFDCHRRAFAAYILPPVISGRLNTKGKFEFLFGRIEIKARLPRGDWVYPLLTLESAENTEFGLHREIRIASSVGNEALTTPDHKDISGHILRAGGFTYSLNESDSTNRSKLPKRQSSKTWADDSHTFEVKWSSGLIVVKVDGVEYGQQTVDIAFGKQSYLTLGIAVGGIHEFPDLVTSSGYTKPWRNDGSQAIYNFYQAKDNWQPTWNTDTALKVDYVKIWAL
ncbi:Beta-1,3-glucan-binding protein [Camponotus japonicus]